jgi:hypothetical protein
MSIKEKYTKKLMVVGIACVVAAGLALGQPAFGADVTLSASGLTIAPDAGPMNVTIVSPAGDPLLRVERVSDTVVWSAAGMPDGSYRYEASDSSGASSDSFEIQNGAIVLPAENIESETSRLEGLLNMVAKLVGNTFDLLVPSAHADNLRAFSSVNPKVNFDETDGGSNPDWAIAANGDSFTDIPECGGDTLGFGIFDNVSNNCRKVLEFRSSGNSTNTFIADTSGDIRLANSAVVIDRSSGFVGIGTGAPFAQLTVQRSGGAVVYVDDNGFFTKR